MASPIIERLDSVIDTVTSSLERNRQQLHVTGRDATGMITSSIGSRLHALGVLLFARHVDAAIFRRNLAESAKAQMHLFERRNQGEPIADSFVVMLSYKELFDALASGDMELAQRLAALMGGREKLERKHDHPLDLALGYSLRAIVLNRPEEAEEWLPKLSQKSSRSKLCYALALAAILKADSIALDDALGSIVAEHAKQSKGNGIYAGTHDELLCVWGIGIANLALSRGLNVNPRPPLIPAELLLSGKEKVAGI